MLLRSSSTPGLGSFLPPFFQSEALRLPESWKNEALIAPEMAKSLSFSSSSSSCRNLTSPSAQNIVFVEPFSGEEVRWDTDGAVVLRPARVRRAHSENDLQSLSLGSFALAKLAVKSLISNGKLNSGQNEDDTSGGAKNSWPRASNLRRARSGNYSPSVYLGAFGLDREDVIPEEEADTTIESECFEEARTAFDKSCLFGEDQPGYADHEIRIESPATGRVLQVKNGEVSVQDRVLHVPKNVISDLKIPESECFEGTRTAFDKSCLFGEDQPGYADHEIRIESPATGRVLQVKNGEVSVQDRVLRVPKNFISDLKISESECFEEARTAFDKSCLFGEDQPGYADHEIRVESPATGRVLQVKNGEVSVQDSVLRVPKNVISDLKISQRSLSDEGDKAVFSGGVEQMTTLRGSAQLSDGECYSSSSAGVNGAVSVVCNSQECRPLHIDEQSRLLGNGGGTDVGDSISGGRGRSGGRPSATSSGAGSGADADVTDLYYQKMLAENPGHPLFLRNYSQFLAEVKRDYSKAEEYYARAVLANPGDGEMLAQYAKIIWEVHRDTERAASYFERAVQAAPEDSYVMAAHASFLWNSDEEEEEQQGGGLATPLPSLPSLVSAGPAY